MSQNNVLASRRRFLGAATGLGAVALGAGWLPASGRAAELPHVTSSDATAKALGYLDNASASHAAEHKAGTDCSNCQFYSGPNGKGFGPCQMFPGKSVSATGWCQAYAAK